MRDKVIAAVTILAGGWLFYEVSELKVTAGRMEVAVEKMEDRFARIEIRIGRLERR